MKESIYEIKSNRQLTETTFEMVLSNPDEKHGITNAGQFVNIKLEGLFLRRPVSICQWDENSITIIYKVVGKGTEQMSSMKAGEKLNILLPLGNGFDISEERNIGQHPAVIGGGVGVPPMYGLCKALKAAGKEPVAVLGFNTAEEAFYVKEFEKLGVKTVVASADGSMGIKGFVTDALATVDYTYFFTCGPEPMLKALDKTVPAEIGGQLSFEERMGCGFGACMGCSCKTKYGNKRICKDGPVLERGEIIW